MTPERHREVAAKGGRSAHAQGVGHEFTPEEARAAGSKGGQKVALDREHMRRIGSLGGQKAARNRREGK